MLLVPAVLLAIIGHVWAVFRDDAFEIDWKLSTVGVPRAVGEYGNDSVVLLTEKNVLTVLTSDGFTAWRKVVSEDQASHGLGTQGDIAVLGGSALTAFNLSNGDLLWMKGNHEAAIVATHPDTRKILIDWLYTIDDRGEVVEISQHLGSRSGSSVPQLDGRVETRAGTLAWDQYGVLTMTDAAGEIKWTRNEGLADVVDALFVPAAADTGEAREELLEDYAEYVDPELTGLRAWTARIVRHTLQLKSLIFYVVKRGPALLLLPERNDVLFGFDQLLVVVTSAGSVFALDAQDAGTVAWVYHDLEATALLPDREHADQFKVVGKDAVYAMSYDGAVLGIAEPDTPTPVSSVEAVEELDGVHLSSSMYGWTLVLPGTQLVGRASRDPLDKTASVGVVVEDSHVRYKYLNPHAAAYATYDPSSRALAVTIVDSVSGRVLTTATHPDPVVINDEWPFNLVFGEHWIVYTYLSQDLSAAPKITVWELYESPDIDTRVTPAEVDDLADTLLPSVMRHTWIAPSRGEPVYSLGLSRSAHGAVTREIILGLQHQVVALPKWLLSAMYPSPELRVPQQSHLSHIYGVDRASLIVTSPTKVESTYFVAALGGADVFFTRSSPIGEIDRIGPSFPRVKLIIFVGVLGFATTTLSPFARRKILEAQWR